MSIQDDIFDVEAALEGKPEKEQFESIVEYIGKLEEDNSVLLHKVEVFNAFKKLLKD